MRHADAKGALDAWRRDIQAARWNSPRDILAMYPRASMVGGNRVVFRIRGNNYRLIARVNFPAQTVEVRFVGTHAEYDNIDAGLI
ncbi:MAG TPA: type II toxin-antitoxin system HigB family toxin [Planctomycetota bacterium]|nr:type II toxin-antitoxin system HigB family toxin [Planctomycetota bacterium]